MNRGSTTYPIWFPACTRYAGHYRASRRSPSSPHKAVVPLPPNAANPAQAVKPMSPVPLRFRPLGGIPTEFYDDNYMAPYIQNFTLAVTRSIGRNMTVDVRYVGTVARKLFSENPVNAPNFLTNGLKEAFDAVRRGDESALFNDLTSSVNGTFGGSGATWLRSQTGVGCPGFTNVILADSLARGDYAAVADCLGWANGGLLGEPGEQGLILKRSVNTRFPSGVPDNFVVANPQFGNLNIVGNAHKTNYHSLQTQFTLRPTSGMSYQGTFTWSRLLGAPSAPNAGTGLVAFYSMDRRNEDYGLQFQHRSLDYRSYGTITCPSDPARDSSAAAQDCWPGWWKTGRSAASSRQAPEYPQRSWAEADCMRAAAVRTSLLSISKPRLLLRN
jgi:hypothetical protein